MQASSDIFLGWQRTKGVDGVERDYYVRQLRDWKGSLPPEQMLPEGMAIYGRLCGWTLARAHARSGDRLAIAAYLGGKDTFDQAVADFASRLRRPQRERTTPHSNKPPPPDASTSRPACDPTRDQQDTLNGLHVPFHLARLHSRNSRPRHPADGHQTSADGPGRRALHEVILMAVSTGLQERRRAFC